MSINRALVVDSSRTTQTISTTLLNDMDINSAVASSEADIWRLIKASQTPFDLLLISRATLGGELPLFVARLRSLRGYDSVPLILLINDKTEDEDIEALYNIGFTQVFSRKEFPRLRDYIFQAKSRNTFEKGHENKVVIIEDDLSQQLVVQAILEKNHCKCFCFTSAEEALEHSKDIAPQLIISDFFLDGKMTALDFVLATRHQENPWFQVPVIVMTGLDDATRKYELVRSGANDYITKPIEPLEFLVRVENQIRYKHLLDTVEEQKKAMHYLAMHDQLTGLYNRHFVAEQVQLSISTALRHQESYSIVVVDIDHFKSINDQNGHDVGDDVLRLVAQYLRKQMRGHDLVARLGGEEFLVLMSHCSLNDAVAKANFLRSGLEGLKPAGLRVTASFGVATLDDVHDNYDSLFKAADEAVYQAKAAGRNRVEVATQVSNSPTSKIS